MKLRYSFGHNSLTSTNFSASCYVGSFSNKNRRWTCRNSFSAVSKALMPSYGAFSAEWYILQWKTNRQHDLDEKATVSANPKPARRARLTLLHLQSSYKVFIYKRRKKKHRLYRLSTLHRFLEADPTNKNCFCITSSCSLKEKSKN